ncbi:hypothetical protein Tco_0397756 [Tanacetum coccineum]
MYKVVHEMKALKRKLKQLSWKNGNVFERAGELRKKVKESQKDVDMFPHDERIKEKSCLILKDYHEAIQVENSLLCQKAKVELLKECDRNTAYFHKTTKERVHRGRIMTITNEDGKYILKQQFEGFIVSNTYGIHKGYERFQSLLSQLEIHGAGVSTEDANQKFLRSLPSACQSSCPQLDHEDLDQVDEYDLEEIDLKWQVAMISMRIKKFYKKTGRKLQFDAKEPVGFDKTKVECYNYTKQAFCKECRTKEDNREEMDWNPEIKWKQNRKERRF